VGYLGHDGRLAQFGEERMREQRLPRADLAGQDQQAGRP
jgi:hypothetical protein